MPLQPPATGKTPWDLVSQVVHQRGVLIAVGVAVIAIAVATAVSIALVNRAAAGGSQISLLYGLVSYTKEHSVPTPSPPAAPSVTAVQIDDYLFPPTQEMRRHRAIPILDGTINIFSGQCIYTRPDEGDLDCEVVIAGVNQQLIQSAARAKNAQPAFTHYNADGIVHTGFPAIIELEYRGNRFEIELEHRAAPQGPATFLIGVKKIGIPKMQLKRRLERTKSFWSCLVDASQETHSK